MRKIIFAALALAIVGCAEKPEPLATPPEEEQTITQATPQGGGSGDSIGIISPSAGAMAPVVGSDSVGGGGSGVGQAAKNQAKNAAAKASGSSLEEYLDD